MTMLESSLYGGLFVGAGRGVNLLLMIENSD
jgi:hypothetical protein